MKRLFFLLLLIPFLSNAQVDTTKALPKVNARGYAWKNGQFDSSLSLPQDTFKLRASDRAIQFKGDLPFYWNGKRWNAIGGANLQQTTDIGAETNDTIIATAMRLKRMLADTVSEADFEIDIIPDIQNQIHDFPAHSRAIFNWIVANRVSSNIKAVIGLGDITNNNTTAEWDTVSSQFSLLDAINIPYVMPPGNHDYGNGFNPAPRDATNYNNTLPPSRFIGQPWYVGHFGTGSENSYIKFDVGTKKFFVIALEFLPRDTILAWAGHLCDSLYAVDPTRDVMITTHAYQSWTGQLANDTTVYSTATYGMTSGNNNGQQMWDKLIKKKRNIKWVFNGHFIVFNYNYNTATQDPSPGLGLTAHMLATGENGNMINQLYANYQDDTLGGRGYIMRLLFKPSQNKVEVKFYSTYLNIYDTRYSAQSFTIDEQATELQNSITSTGVVSAEGDVRTEGQFRSRQLHNRNVVYVGQDGRLIDTDSLRYYDKETNGINAGLYVKPKMTTDTMHIDVQADFNNKAYAVWRSNRNSPTSINIIHDNTDTTLSTSPTSIFGFQNGKKYPNAPFLDLRTAFNADAKVPQTRLLGSCETCPGSRWYTYNEIFLADSATVSSSTVGDYQYQSRQQIRGGSSSVKRANTSGLEMGAFISQLFVVSNVDHLGKFIAFKDQVTTFNQGNAVDQYYSFYTNHGAANHIRSWGFYQLGTIQKNFFNNTVLIGDSSWANAGSNKLYVSGTSAFDNNVGIGTLTPNASALLDLTSTTKALLLPRMTKTQRDAISSPVAGMAIYQTDNTPGLRVYNGTNWMKFTEATD